ncbi:MAG: hypothetical protein KF726_22545 [Anaerolineae bacterium]|nr:hypothetical protein [Anaerolineae bacterium]
MTDSDSDSNIDNLDNSDSETLISELRATSLLAESADTIDSAVSEIPAEIVPQPDDADADADIARPSRVMQYRVQRRSQFSMALPALLLIGLGVLFLIHLLTPESQLLTTTTALGAAVGSLSLGLLFRFLINGRREIGVFLIGMVLLLWMALAAAGILGALDLTTTWPLAICAVGVALLLMLLFVRERGIVLPALALIIVGVVVLMFTTGNITADVITAVAQYWPLLLIVFAVIFLPSAFRSRVR